MEFRLRPLGFMELFAKQQSSGSYGCCFARNSIKPRGPNLNSMN